MARLITTRHHQGRLIGRMEALGFQLKDEAILSTLTEDILKTSEIEGDLLNKEQVRSSIARRLGMDRGALAPVDRHVDGIVRMMLDATQSYEAPLTKQRLFGWHRALFPTGRSGMRPIRAGAWRDDHSGPMQVVSGAIGNEQVHFEAPAAKRLTTEIKSFLNWFNDDASLDLVLKAAQAHLWFVTLHPFDDGNGRIARAIADMCLARSEQSDKRFYSMSAQIQLERKQYYKLLEETQRGGLNITPWMIWFLGCLEQAFQRTEITLETVLKKARYWESHSGFSLNERQRQMLNHLMDGFAGKLTSSKWAKLTRCSQDTAHRDIMDLIQKGLLAKEAGGGRSTSYSLSKTRVKTGEA